MNIEEALDIVVARTGHVRFRELCDASHPDHEYWRTLVISQADESAPPPRPVSLPGLHVQMRDLAGTVTRSVVRAIKGEDVKVSEEAARVRRAICWGDGERPRCDQLRDDERCAQCGCYMPFAIHLVEKPCPLGKWPSPDDRP